MKQAQENRRLRVAAYWRVGGEQCSASIDTTRMHYTQMIAENPEWVASGFYTDHGSKRSEQDFEYFKQMINDARSDKIDLIITRSVSGFGHTMQECIAVIKMLRGLNPPVDVYFENENLHTLRNDCEQILSFIRMMAEIESTRKREAALKAWQRRKAKEHSGHGKPNDL